MSLNSDRKELDRQIERTARQIQGDKSDDRRAETAKKLTRMGRERLNMGIDESHR